MNTPLAAHREKKTYTYKFPSNKFELLEELPLRTYKWGRKDKTVKNIVQHMVRLKCKKCGDVKDVCDKPAISCKQGLCHERFIDRTGHKYGNLTVIKPVKTDAPDCPWQWLCKCSCGKEELVSARGLVNGKESCCVCGVIRTKIKNTIPNEGAKWARVIRGYKREALRRGKEFSLTYDECIALFKGSCVYCNMPTTPYSDGLIRNGIDCKDASKGYVTDNVASCCPICNVMKAEHSIPSFLKHTAKIYKLNKTLIETLNDYPEREYSQAAGNRETPHRTRHTQFGGV